MSDEKNEALVIGMKIVGALTAVVTFRWLVNIFKGNDRQLDKKELKELVALLFFIGAGTYIIYKEGQRTDLSHDVYGMGYLSIVFGCLVVVLHLEKSLELVLKIMQAAKGITIKESHVETHIEETKNEAAPTP